MHACVCVCVCLLHVHVAVAFVTCCYPLPPCLSRVMAALDPVKVIVQNLTAADVRMCACLILRGWGTRQLQVCNVCRVVKVTHHYDLHVHVHVCL